jgi:transcriptional regulator GlxA family with amidase domain
MSRDLDVLHFQSNEEPEEESNRIAEDILAIFRRDLKLGPEDPVDIRVNARAETMRAQPETAWRIETLAEEAGLSPSQFSRRFRKLFHCSPHHFLIQQRVEKARTLLMESQMTVGEIADTLGYADLGFFSRQFKQKTGLSPLEMRSGRG